MASTGTPSSQMASGQSPQGWDNKTTPAGQVNNMATAGNSMARPAATPGSSTYNLDPNAYPRTPEAMPRQVGNQTSSYTTFPNNVADSNAAGRGTGQVTGYQSSAPAPSSPAFQRPALGVTQTGFATSGATGQLANSVTSAGNANSSTVLPGREEFAVTPPAPPANVASVPTPPANRLAPAPQPAASTRGGAARDEFPLPDVPGPRTDLEIPMPPQ
jgi:hypothetical protein